MDNVQYLNDDEVSRFVNAVDHNNDGYIDYHEIEQKLDQAYDELNFKTHAHRARKHGQAAHEADATLARHQFIRTMMGSDAQRIPRDEFRNLVRSWKIPSLQQSKKEEAQEKSYFKRLPGWRKIRAYWAVHGPEICFLCLVVGMQLAFAIWQLVKYQTTPKYRAAFGWGVVMAKTCAGALYPTFFFVIISMSRYFSTALRRSYFISRFFNWDHSQAFHIAISSVAILLATLHALGHLTGSFVHGSNSNNKIAVAELLGPGNVRGSYIDYIRSLPGFTGIAALGLLYILSLLSIPQVRRWNYEVFQLGHLLMFPIIGLMMAHGTAGLLQWPMFGYFLAFPTLLVLVERITRVLLGFHRLKASLTILDDDTVEITTTIPTQRVWTYQAGQYIFLQVPKIGLFQWHPFTVSLCRGNEIMVHIKTDGNWTCKLRDLAGESGESTTIDIGVNGPFGAPAQRFYDFNHTVIIGAGIGVTPFSGILADLQYKDDGNHGGPGRNRTVPGGGLTRGETISRSGGESTPDGAPKDNIAIDAQCAAPRNQRLRASLDFTDDYRRVDFHWMVRDRNYLLWHSDLLNDVYLSQMWHREHEKNPHLDIRLTTHVTAKQNDIVVHVYRWLLEIHRTLKHSVSPLTGLLNPTHFGRPDFDRILDEHYEEMREFCLWHRKKNEIRENDGSTSRVAVFYCGNPMVGEILADKCKELSIRGRKDGTKITYHFMMEVF
ncbi:hypothetical protein QQS21_000835 [Conoideocrella luteorostrata]|uniref:Uncharacterized protein n=1 Tax=Conoideocrella luteorostrata TaxID=1105319 RepID=A0AAJ0CYB1_9HYPO|nr:hypothetical protein QQS21_000835 [Conoideocrella luteorostrata]